MIFHFLRLEISKRSDNLNGSIEQTSGKLNHGKSNVSSYFRRHEEALTRCHWQVIISFAIVIFTPILMILKFPYSNIRVIQIIQLVYSTQAGQFFAWVVVDGIMLKIPIFVPRVFYLNSRLPTEEFSGKRVNKTLPHGRHSYNLYEVLVVLLLPRLPF